MSTIKVEVTRLSGVRAHGNADALELATVGGWQMCVKKGTHHDGDEVVYFEPGTVLPRAMAEQLGVVNYLSEKTDIHGDRVLVIHRVKLRGEPSFGLVVTPEPGMELGQNVANHYGATKFQPPVKLLAGDSMPDDPRFPAYTDIENMRSYPEVLRANEEVVATEKLHGTNCRVGFVTDEAGDFVPMAGSRTLRRADVDDPDAMVHNLYWFPHTLPGVAALLRALHKAGHVQAVLFGEVFGAGIQPYGYGLKTRDFHAFDLMINGQYVHHDEFAALCEEHGIATVPLVYRGPFDLAKVKELSEGDSLVGGSHGREGVVVRPVQERVDPQIGRVILKYIGDAYLFGKAAEQDTTDI